MLIQSKSCEEQDYVPFEDAKEILEQNNYSYFYTQDPTEDEIYIKSKTQNFTGEDRYYGSVVIVKDGDYYTGINPNIHALKNKQELIQWLSKYLDIK